MPHLHPGGVSRGGGGNMGVCILVAVRRFEFVSSEIGDRFLQFGLEKRNNFDYRGTVTYL